MLDIRINIEFFPFAFPSLRVHELFTLHIKVIKNGINRS